MNRDRKLKKSGCRFLSRMAAGVVLQTLLAIQSQAMDLGIVWKDGVSPLTVEKVQPTSAAAQAKLEAGDRVLSLEGQATPTRGVLMSLAASFARGSRLKILVERPGREVPAARLTLMLILPIDDGTILGDSVRFSRKAGFGPLLIDGDAFTGARILATHSGGQSKEEYIDGELRRSTTFDNNGRMRERREWGDAKLQQTELYYPNGQMAKLEKSLFRKSSEGTPMMSRVEWDPEGRKLCEGEKGNILSFDVATGRATSQAISKGQAIQSYVDDGTPFTGTFTSYYPTNGRPMMAREYQLGLWIRTTTWNENGTVKEVNRR